MAPQGSARSCAGIVPTRIACAIGRDDIPEHAHRSNPGTHSRGHNGAHRDDSGSEGSQRSSRRRCATRKRPSAVLRHPSRNEHQVVDVREQLDTSPARNQEATARNVWLHMLEEIADDNATKGACRPSTSQCPTTPRSHDGGRGTDPQARRRRLLVARRCRAMHSQQSTRTRSNESLNLRMPACAIAPLERASRPFSTNSLMQSAGDSGRGRGGSASKTA